MRFYKNNSKTDLDVCICKMARRIMRVDFHLQLLVFINQNWSEAGIREENLDGKINNRGQRQKQSLNMIGTKKT